MTEYFTNLMMLMNLIIFLFVGRWVLEDPHYKELMQCPLTPSLEVLERCTFAICVDISAPHAIVAELAQWSELLDEQANAVVQVRLTFLIHGDI
tara:strand:- start:215 stop:496 length:282 start_codon:yes stop_codon:yes gene_type:complete